MSIGISISYPKDKRERGLKVPPIDDMKRWLSEKIEINYLYFSILFIPLSIFSLSHVLFLEKPLWGIGLFLAIYAVGQAFLEVWTFILIAYSLKRWGPRWSFFSFIALSFIVLLVHFTDFTLLRLMDATVSYVFKFLFGRGFDHLLTAFAAVNINPGMLLIILSGFLLVPFAGIFLYWATGRIVKIKPWSLTHTQMLLAMAITSGSLFVLECLAHPYLERSVYHKFQKALPLGKTLLAPEPPCIHLSSPLLPPRDEIQMHKLIPPLSAARKPNIYLFVIEALRRDCITSDTAPHLTAFAKENTDFPLSFSNGNWSPEAWCAIFQSDLPFYWAIMREEWKQGSLPLKMLKELGYQIDVFSAADLSYFNMDRLIFGENRHLANTMCDFSVDKSLEACDRDERCIFSFQQALQKSDAKEGHAYIFFLDSTHSEYSFPKDFTLRFTPSAKQIDYLTLTQKEIEPVKNRYLNAIFFVDSLIGKFLDTLKNENLYEDAVIVFTGDHGEEFYEEGSLFHGSHLNHYQTHVPIFCRFPGQTPLAKSATHVDLFPSILHYISGIDPSNALFDGSSLFLDKKDPFRIAVLQNGADTPVEFSIAQGEDRIQLRFLQPRDIYNQTELEVISLEATPPSPSASLQEIVEASFSSALRSLSTK